MKATYIARVRRSPDGWYAIDFPDLPGTHAQSRTMEEVQKEASDALAGFLMAAEMVGEEVASASPIIDMQPGELALIVSADVEAYKQRLDSKPVRKTVSLPAWMAKDAEKRGLSLSKVLQEALNT